MKYLFLVTMFSLLSCARENPSPFNQFEIDATLRIYLKDIDGMNLLNILDYRSENFRIFKDVNGQAVEIYNPQSDTPRNFLIDTQTNPISIILFMNYNAGQ